jgi:flagellar basal body rod protein FlgC
MEILAAALQGLNSAEVKVDQAATRIAQAGNPVNGSSGDTVDLAAEIVNLAAAKIDYQANLKALQAGDEMAKHTLDILA